DTLQIVRKLKSLCDLSPSLTGMVATKKFRQFLSKLESAIGAYDELFLSHPESEEFKILLNELESLETSLVNLITQVELFQIGFNTVFIHLLPWEKCAIEKELQYTQDLKEIIADALEEIEPDYRKLKNMGKKIGRTGGEELFSIVVDEITKGAGMGVPFMGLLVDQYFDKRKSDKLREKVVKKLFKKGLKDTETLADIVHKDVEWVKRIIKKLEKRQH
ncbi:MAG: hypothetical protein OEZ25_08860, partial [Candidatus Bathyarchaeota archaeon]|nr:hypothetical protein [Candidatus Bathyarchaeota archaeon]